MLSARINELWDAVQAVLDDKSRQEFFIAIDGLNETERQDHKFVSQVCAFIMHLEDGISKVKVLFTSRPQPEIKQVFRKLIHIEYDKERKGVLASKTLCQAAMGLVAGTRAVARARVDRRGARSCS